MVAPSSLTNSTLRRCWTRFGCMAAEHKYQHIRVGSNSRLDTMQAAILIEKLNIFDEELGMRQIAAERYNSLLGDYIEIPHIEADVKSAWAQYTIKTPLRDEVSTALGRAGYPSVVYYPLPLHMQPAYCGFPVVSGGLPNSELLVKTVLSLPMHPYLKA